MTAGFSPEEDGVTEVLFLTEKLLKSPVEAPELDFSFRGTCLKDPIAVKNCVGRGRGRGRTLPSILDIRLPNELTQKMNRLVNGRGRALALSLRKVNQPSLNSAVCADSRSVPSASLYGEKSDKESNLVTSSHINSRRTASKFINSSEPEFHNPYTPPSDEPYIQSPDGYSESYSAPLLTETEFSPISGFNQIQRETTPNLESQLDFPSLSRTDEESFPLAVLQGSIALAETQRGRSPQEQHPNYLNSSQSLLSSSEAKEVNIQSDDSVCSSSSESHSSVEDTTYTGLRKLPGFEESRDSGRGESSDFNDISDSLSNTTLPNMTSTTTASDNQQMNCSDQSDDRLCTVVMSNLPTVINKQMIEGVVSEFGEIKSIKLNLSISDSVQNYTAYIQMSEADSAEYVVSCLDKADGLFLTGGPEISCKLLTSD